jgi:hypothetical protein
MSTTIRNPVRTVVLAAAVAALAAASSGGAAAADESAAVQDRYVGSLLVAADDSRPYNQMDDYVRVLAYWHQHPDWGLGG